jgi:hypothetical protein
MTDARDDRGQAATELALVVPLVVVLLLAAVQTALVARDEILVVHAARAAARTAAVDPSTANVRFAATHAGPLKPNDVRTETSYRGGTDMVTVELQYRSATDVPIVGPLFPDVQLRAKATMRLERGQETEGKFGCIAKPAGTASPEANPANEGCQRHPVGLGSIQNGPVGA